MLTFRKQSITFSQHLKWEIEQNNSNLTNYNVPSCFFCSGEKKLAASLLLKKYIQFVIDYKNFSYALIFHISVLVW